MSSNNTFAVGDIVKLKSGGPEMIVKVLPSEHKKPYICQWFAGKNLSKVRFQLTHLKN